MAFIQFSSEFMNSGGASCSYLAVAGINAAVGVLDVLLVSAAAVGHAESDADILAARNISGDQLLLVFLLFLFWLPFFKSRFCL